MSKEKKPEVKSTGHIYDEIEELDHAPPRWFNILFLGTVIFGLGYHFYYTIGGGDSIDREYAADVKAEEIANYERLAKEGGAKNLTEDQFAVLAKDGSAVKVGAASFQTKCVSCHGAQGQGGIGPNLTDAYWIHGSKMTDIHQVISKGVADKGMPPWGAVLKADEVNALTVFIRSLSGSNPPGAKEPQGELSKVN